MLDLLPLLDGLSGGRPRPSVTLPVSPPPLLFGPSGGRALPSLTAPLLADPVSATSLDFMSSPLDFLPSFAALRLAPTLDVSV